MRYGGSGITTLNNWAFDNAPGYHIVVRRNFVWNNKTLDTWEKIGKLSDGNGILLDMTDQEQGQSATNPNADAVVKPATSQTLVTTMSVASPPAPEKPKRPEWKGRALIANNVSAFNGGSGIHTFCTKHVDIINNTTYWNGGIVGYQELFPNRSDDVVILNNIIAIQASVGTIICTQPHKLFLPVSTTLWPVPTLSTFSPIQQKVIFDWRKAAELLIRLVTMFRWPTIFWARPAPKVPDGIGAHLSSKNKLVFCHPDKGGIFGNSML